MELKNLFVKPVDRPIEGVIKADDEAALRQEMEEYVLTREVEKRLGVFLDAYNNYEGANGVWVSGFFGSGKSHLLKMLALVMENREIEGTPALEFFLPKCGDNEILRGDLKRAVAIPSKSILFNIDQKADVISKSQVDALLAVFVKVFDEMCGYYGKQGHIAQFERDLDSRGVYQAFRDAFEELAEIPWERGREQSIFESESIAAAYGRATGNSTEAARDILDAYRNDYHVSIEDFAGMVNTYIESRGPRFRLNFFVDEVGQYIADNVKLMTNLQTIAESLATKCRGRAWIIVTAQEDMSSVMGEMGKQQSNDFTKIQARFNNRMKLTSSDVAEVIQKRLLLKNEEGVGLLSEVYHNQVNNFKTLFTFVDGSKDYKIYSDRDHFIHSYPFIPYQFPLFQSAIQNLSLHDAFEGKHSSVGERSMLGVFQQVAVQISGREIGELATFDLMFEGIRTALTSRIQSAISQVAEKQLNNEFAIRLLKALFLVKYVKEFKTTVRNLCVLVRERFDQDPAELEAKVKEALDLLEQQTYIHRSGEYYEYLTDEEKDVEQEIKHTEVESDAVAEELEKLIFEGVIRSRKIRFEENGQDYGFSRKLDDKLFGREHELAVHVISPFHEKCGDEDTLVRNSWGRDELLVLLAPDDLVVKDLLMYKRTEKYIRQNITVSQQDSVRKILRDKGDHNRERYGDIQNRVKSLLEKARLFVGGHEVDINSGEAQARIYKAFQELVARVYPNLKMLRGVSYTEEQVGKILSDRQRTLQGMDVTTLSEAEQELLAYINGNQRQNVRTTMKHLVENFERKPYGWYYGAILCILAKLCVRGKVEVKIDGTPLEGSELEGALRRSPGHGNVVLEPQTEFTASQIRALKELFEDFFDTPPSAGEAKALGKEAEEAFKSLLGDLSSLKSREDQYPFLAALDPVMQELKETEGKSYTWFLQELVRREDRLLDLKERVIDPIRKFMAGPQRSIYDDAREFLAHQQPNLDYGFSDDAGEIRQILEDPECFRGDRMQRVKSTVNKLKQGIDRQLEGEIGAASASIAALKNRLAGMGEFRSLSDGDKEELTRSFEGTVKTIEAQNIIALIRDTARRFEESEYQLLLAKLSSLASRKETATGTGSYDRVGAFSDTEQGSSQAADPEIEYVSSRKIQVAFEKAWLADETDVESYLEALRRALLEEIGKGKRIQI